jgi:peroxiredoxin-like protein
MKPLPHRYEVELSGTPTGYATACAAGMPDLRSAPPADFGGPGDAWSPEHLFMAAIETCLLFTLRAVARASNLQFSSLAVSGAGTVDRQAGVTRFTEVVLRAKLVVPEGTDKERAHRILEKAEKSCLVSASISTPIRMESEILFG